MPKRDSHPASSSSAHASAKRHESANRASSSPPSSTQPPNFESSCPYEILGVPRDATSQKIKLSYRKLALKHHPDRQSSDLDKKAAHQNFAAIGNAYETVGDEGRRREHDESVRRQQQQQQQQQQRQPRRHGSSRGFDDGMGSFGHDPFSMFDDPFFSSSFGGSRSRGASGRPPSTKGRIFTDPFELFEQFFADDMGRHQQQHHQQHHQHQQQHQHHGQRQRSTRSSSGRVDPFDSDPFFSAHGSMSGRGGGFGGMMSGHFGMMDSMMSQMSSSFNASSSSSSFNGGGHQSVSTSTRTSIVNGVRQTITERTVVHPDGRVERHVETIGGGGNDAGRISSSANHSALGYDGGGRRRRR